MASEKLCLLPDCSGNQKPNRAEAGGAPLLGEGGDARFIRWDLFSQMWGDGGNCPFAGAGCGGSG